MFAQLPPGSYPKTIYVSPALAVDQIPLSDFSFPIAVKPDVGMMGFMFRKIKDLQELKNYHARMPVDYIIQDFVDYPIEVSVFYYRFPKDKKGTITGFLRKDYLQVTGDGTSTLWELISAYSRVRFKLDEMRAKLIGLIQAPATKIAQVTTAPAAKLARVFGAYANKDAA